MLIDGTNKFVEKMIAEKERAGKLTPGSQWKKWRAVTMEEMKGPWLSSLIWVSTTVLISSHTGRRHGNVTYPFSMTSFLEIVLRKSTGCSTSPTHRLDKIEPLLNLLLATFQGVFYHGCDVLVDESMVGFKVWVSFKQYCPLKLTTYGLKGFVVCDSKTRYVLNIILYTGHETRAIYLSSVDPELPMLTQIVVALAANYLDKGHHIDADRLYSNVPLVEELERRETGFTRTLNKSWCQLPREGWKKMVLA